MVLFACGTIGSAAGFAQSATPEASASSSSAPEGAGSENSGPPPGAEQQAEIPVFAVTDVEVTRGASSTDVVLVRGLSSTKGWENAALIPITQGAPSDGILDLVLVATPAPGNEATGFGELEAVLPVSPGHPYKGVRVRSANNALTTKAIPASAKGNAPTEDCSKCVGKVFVPKGSTPPAGVAATEIVKEDELPRNLRIVGPKDGISDLQSNPNRLTLVIGDDGKIVDAAWD